MENDDQVKQLNELKAEIYDISKEAQTLRSFIGQVGNALGLEGDKLTLDEILKAAQTAATEVTPA